MSDLSIIGVIESQTLNIVGVIESKEINIIGEIIGAGPAGETGLQGIKGESFTVDVTGLLADKVNFDTQIEGFSYLATDTGDIYIKNSDISGDWSLPIPFKGEKGDTGIQGIQGETGTQGLQGETGLTGIQGLQGVDGLQGETGLTGIQGETGVSAYEVWINLGNVGTEAEYLLAIKGADGIQGLQGEIGLTGEQGIQGIQGETGLTGVEVDYNSYASVKDGTIYTVIDFKRIDNTLYLNSILSNKDVNGFFQTCTLTYYDIDGFTLLDTTIWTFTYDVDGNIITKVVA